MSEQNQPIQPQGQPERENQIGSFIRNNLAWLIPVGLILLFFLIPATRNWLSNQVRCSLLSSRDEAARADACRKYLGKSGFAGAPCYEDCTEAVDYENARRIRTYELLKAYIDKYEANARTPRYQEMFRLLDSVACEQIQRFPDRKAENCRLYKEDFGQAGICYEECHSYLDTYDCEAAQRAAGREEAYLRYMDKYGPEGKCYEAFRQALEKGVPASMEETAGRTPAAGEPPGSKTPAATAAASKKAAPASSRTCQAFTAGNRKFRAIKLGPLWWTAENMNKNGFVNWQQARAACPAGWRLPCTQEVEHLIREFYSNPDKAYTYLSSNDPRNCEFNLEFTGFQWTPGMATTEEGQAAGFWCWNEYTPNGAQAGSFLFRKAGRSVETIMNTDKTMGLNCRCVKESNDYKKSSLRFTPCVGMP